MGKKHSTVLYLHKSGRYNQTTLILQGSLLVTLFSNTHLLQACMKMIHNKSME
jgi:hypothetical protein